MTKIRLDDIDWQIDIDRPLGSPGGFGAVFEGEGPDGKPVAIKQLKQSFDNLEKRELKVAEYFAGKKFEHVTPVLASGEFEGRHYIVMQRADESLADHLSTHATGIGDKDTVRIMLDIADGLAEIPEIVHRDLKPQNVLRFGTTWKICDYGIARFIEDATSKGTLKHFRSPWYAAPEQWREERATNATDVYALGCIGFALLRGSPPFPMELRSEVRDAHLFADPPSLVTSSPTLTALILDMLVKHPDARPSISSVQNILRQLRARLANREVDTHPLAQANLKVAEERSQAEAEEARARAAEQNRTSLAKSAMTSIGRVIEALFHSVESVASHAVRSGIERISLGKGALVFNRTFAVVDAGAFSESGWDVVAGLQIELWQEREVVRSANLWFANINASGYHWWEVAYWELGNSRRKATPYGISSRNSIRDADFAASNITHSTNLAYQPRLSDQAHADQFIDRWQRFLADAATGAYRPPSRLPEDR
jgi:serine/threonine protein kinase